MLITIVVIFYDCYSCNELINLFSLIVSNMCGACQITLILFCLFLFYIDYMLSSKSFIIQHCTIIDNHFQIRNWPFRQFLPDTGAQTTTQITALTVYF